MSKYIQNKQSGADLEFYTNISGTPTLDGYVTNAGAWFFGPSGFTGNHFIHGSVGIEVTSPSGLAVGTATKTLAIGDSSGGLLSLRNTNGGNTTTELSAYAGSNGFFIDFTGQTTGTNNTLSFRNNSTNNSNSVTVVGKVDSTGTWTFGPTTGGGLLHQFQSNGQTNVNINSATGNEAVLNFKINASTKYQLYQTTGGAFQFNLSGTTTVGSIDTTGAWTLGNTSSTSTRHFIQNNANSGLALTVSNSATSTPLGMQISLGASPNNGTQYFLVCSDSTTTRMQVFSNGGISNFSANNSNLSDERIKRNIVNAPSQLAFIQALQVRDFEYRDAPGRVITGLVAQEVEALDPTLVSLTGGEYTINGDKFTAKAIHTHNIYHKLIKAVQELAAENEELKAYKAQSEDRLATMEARLNKAGF